MAKLSEKNFICFDTEDDSPECLADPKRSGFDKKVTQIAAICGDKSEYYSRGNVKDFLKWLQQRPETKIYANNVQYDLGNLFPDHLDDLDITMVGGRLIKGVWGKKTFLDVFNLYQLSAKNLAIKMGLDIRKGEMDIHSREYVFTDVEIIWQAVDFAHQFCEINGLKNVPSTIAGAAIKLWKHWGGVNTHDSTLLSRQALYGGRVELFKPVNETDYVCYTDINSLYPFCMTKEFPLYFEPQNDLCEFGIADVTVKQARTDLTVLPHRTEEGDILYPWGTFRGQWTCPELRLAQKHGCKILKVHEVIGCDEGYKPYADFTTRVYEKRLKADNKAESLFFKLLMNNLYGRLGISGTITRSLFRDGENDDWGVTYGEKVLVDYEMPLADETNWGHAAYVTSYGRMELFKHLEQIGTGRMIYCDTDSCIFDCPDKKIPFPVGDKLGMMKLEGWETDCHTYAPKTYQFGKIHKAKGIPVRLAKEFITTHKATFDLPFKMRESIKFFDRNNSKKLSVWRKVDKLWQTDYKKKRLKKGKFTPLQINQE